MNMEFRQALSEIDPLDTYCTSWPLVPLSYFAIFLLFSLPSILILFKVQHDVMSWDDTISKKSFLCLNGIVI